MSHLQHPDLSYCDSVTDSELTAVAAGCPDFSYIGLEECKNVTGVGVALFPNDEVPL